MKMLLFFDSLNISFIVLFAITCFLKFCIIFWPRSFLSLSPLIIDSSNLFLLYWLTFILKFIDLSNYSNFPVLSSKLERWYFWRNRQWPHFLSFSLTFLFWHFSSLLRTSWTLLFLIHLNRQLNYMKPTFYKLCNFLSIFTKSKGDERIFQLLYSDRSLSNLIKRLEIFSQFKECFISESDIFFLAMISEPVPFFVSALEEIFGWLWDFVDLFFEGIISFLGSGISKTHME